MIRRRRGFAALAIGASAVFMLLSGAPAQAATVSVDAAAGFSEASPGPSPITLPHRTFVRADGSVDVVADPQAVARIRTAAAPADADCGYACDGKDPASYVVAGATCGSDAMTIHRHEVSPAYAELRWSPRCGTSWTRTCCYVRAGGFGYTSLTGPERARVTNFSGVYSGTPVWTAMLYNRGTLRYKACLDRVVAGGPSEWSCTPRW
jgi:hypothetical protein